MAKVYPIRNQDGDLRGWSRWPNHQNHPSIEDDGVEAIAYTDKRTQRSQKRNDYRMAILDELNAAVPGAKARILNTLKR